MLRKFDFAARRSNSTAAVEIIVRMRRECSIFGARIYYALFALCTASLRKVNANAGNPRISQLYACEMDAKNTSRVASRFIGNARMSGQEGRARRDFNSLVP